MATVSNITLFTRKLGRPERKRPERLDMDAPHDVRRESTIGPLALNRSGATSRRFSQDFI